MAERRGLIVTASITILVALITNLSVIPIQWPNSFAIGEYGTGTQGFYRWTLLNSTIIELGSSVSGNATFQGYQFQGSGATPILYVLSPSQFTTWVATSPLGEPKASTTLRQPIIDFQSKILSFKFSFTAKEGGIYYFLLTDTNYIPTFGNSAALNYSATTVTPPFWYRIIAVLVPVGAVVSRRLDQYHIVQKDNSLRVRKKKLAMSSDEE